MKTERMRCAVDDPWLSSVEQVVWRDWLFGGLATLGRIDAFFVDRFGISAQQFHILVVTSEGDSNGVAMTELSVAILLPPSSLTYQVRQLVDKGLLTIRQDERDRRVRRVVMTQEGRDFLTECSIHHVRHVREVFFSCIQESEFDAFASVVGKVRALNSAPG